MDIALPP